VRQAIKMIQNRNNPKVFILLIAPIASHRIGLSRAGFPLRSIPSFAINSNNRLVSTSSALNLTAMVLASRLDHKRVGQPTKHARTMDGDFDGLLLWRSR
jgi:hypothetical protein